MSVFATPASRIHESFVVSIATVEVSCRGILSGGLIEGLCPQCLSLGPDSPGLLAERGNTVQAFSHSARSI